MIRKYNYTGRKKISPEHISINVNNTSESIYFDAIINLNSYDFPVDAEVYMEAFVKNSMLLFNFGTKENISQPDNTAITQLPLSINNTDLVTFRIKVVDPSTGVIYGLNDRLYSQEKQDKEKEGNSILPVRFDDLGPVIWRVSYEYGRPYLFLNSNVEAFKDQNNIYKDWRIVSLILPNIVESVYTKILNESGDRWEDEWCEEWKKFLVFNLNYTGDVENDDTSEIIEFAIKSFSRKFEFLPKFNKKFSL